MINQLIAHYRIVEKLGSGGMGVVYKAEDTRLGRAVALKVLPDALAADNERMARLSREAQLLASLNHPHIATVYGFEDSAGVRALAMELVSGPTLAERIAAGGMPIGEALAIARQVADALDYAHEHGVIHRDLKPANIKLTLDGSAKILDFGLAKALGDSPAESPQLSNSPTLSLGATKAGVILGTAAYMSPEQARGAAADKRSDIWAFGCVLFEMLTGQRAFPGDTASDTLASVLKSEPDWNSLPAEVPAHIRHLLRRCLEKNPKRRLRDIGDALLELEAPAAPEPGVVPAAQAGWLAVLRHPATWGLAIVLAGLAWFVARSTGPPALVGPGGVQHFVISMTQYGFEGEIPLSPIAIAPDGSRFAFLGNQDGKRYIFMRALNSAEPVMLTNTEGAQTPFFSPDGKWLGFFVDGAAKKISVSGGAAIPLGTLSVTVPGGASWGSNDIIVYSPDFSEGLYMARASGGAPEPLTRRNLEKGDSGHTWPDVLPGGKAALFTVEQTGRTFDDATIELVMLDSKERRVLIEGGTGPKYVSSGHILFGRLGSLYAVPFDLAKLEVTGPPMQMVEGVVIHPGLGTVQYNVSGNGTLLYAEGKWGQWWTMHRVDRKGRSTALPSEPHSFDGPRVSPNGKQIIAFIRSSDDDIWIYDIPRGTLTRMTSTGENHWPVWSPRGDRFVFTSSRRGPVNLHWQPADGSSPPEQILKSENSQMPTSWSADGTKILFTEISPKTGDDIWVYSVEQRKASLVVNSSFAENEAVFSPDGEWIAYTSNESGRKQIYAQRLAGGGKIQISVGGGTQARWAPSGRELFYLQDDKLMAVNVSPGPRPEFGSLQVLLSGVEKAFEFPPVFDVFPNGNEFLVLRTADKEPPKMRVHVVLNWLEELRRKAPSKAN